LTFVYFSTYFNKKVPSPYFGFGIGSVVFMGTIAFGAFNGACVNIIRIFGPSILTCLWKNSFSYYLASLLGGSFGAYYY